MKYKKCMVALCLIICLFSIVSVSASDVNDTILEESDDALSSSESVVLGEEASNGTFTDLANEIANANEELNLTRNYVYSNGDSKYGIIIENQITINGNGFAIDGKNQAKAFNIKSDHVILNNISFVNCSFLNKEGIVSYNNSDYGVLSNCSFVNCSAYNSVVYFANSTNCVLSDCSFVNCANKYYCVVCWDYWSINGVLTNCSFVDCGDSNNDLHVVDCGLNSYISGSRFVNCKGAVYLGSSNFTLTDCSFVNCGFDVDYSTMGGAVYCGYGNGTLSNCSFVDCYSTFLGGAVYMGSSTNRIVLANSSFVNCYSKQDGGAVYLDQSPNSVMFNCSFMNCFAREAGGGVYWAGRNSDLFNCSFASCSANKKGGAVYWVSHNSDLFNCSFLNCSSKANREDNFDLGGGAVYWVGYDNSKLFNCSFVNCSDYCQGGAVYWKYEKGQLLNCSFVNCLAGLKSRYGEGGAILWEGSKGVVKGCSFVNCSSYIPEEFYGGGGAVSFLYNYNCIIDCIFVNCSSESRGGAIQWHGAQGDLSNCTFVNCSASEDGGAVYWNNSPGVIRNCSFVNCSSGRNGGALWGYMSWTPNGFLANSTFVNCFAHEQGGACYLTGFRFSLSNCSFVFCSSEGNGGAVYWYGGNGTLRNCSFVFCSSEGNGGALYWFGDDGAVIDSSFVNCSVQEDNCCGGGIFFEGSGCYLINSAFEGNVACNGSDWYGVNHVGNKFDTILAVPDVTAVPTTGSIVATLKDGRGNPVKGVDVNIAVGNLNNTSKTNDAGQVTLDISSLNQGNYTASIESAGTDLYSGAVATANVIVKKIDTVLTVPDVIALDNESAKVVATFNDIYGNPVSGVNVKITVGSLAKTIKTDDNGQAVLDIRSLEAGMYDVAAKTATTVIYNRADPVTATAIVSDGKINTVLTVPNVIAIDNVTSKVVATLKDVYGNAIGGVNVKITVGDLAKTLKTDDNGQAVLDISSLAPGKYDVNVKTATMDKYNKATATASAIVSDGKIDTALTVPDVITIDDATAKVVATFKDIYGNVIGGVNVKITVGSIAKTLKTNADGQVTLDISSLAPGKYVVSVKTATTAVYNRATATASAIVSDGKIDTVLNVPNVVAISGSGRIVAAFKDVYGNAISGVNVKITVGSLAKTLQTDANGQVSLDISSLAPGEYAVSVKTAATDIYNRATATASAIVSADKVDTALTVPDVTTAHGSGDKISATFKDVYGNVISGVNVKITVGSIAKTLKTDANGKVALDVSTLAPGNYTAEIKTATTDIYNRATATAGVTIF